MAHSNNHYGAPMGFCDNHGIGYVKSIGCADCNAKAAKAKGVATAKLTSEVISMRVFPGDELRQMANNKAIMYIHKNSEPNTPLELANKYYLFTKADNPNVLYAMVNNEQAIELTFNVSIDTRTKKI